MRSADLTPIARDVMKLPAGGMLVFLSFIAAYVLAVLPWTGTGLLLRPDFVLLVLLFWTMHEPRAIGQGVAFFAGLVMDVSDSMLLGQNALAYVIAVYAVQVLRVRIGAFGLAEQTLHMLAIAIIASGVKLVLNLLLGATFPGPLFFVSPLLTAMLWAPANWILFSRALRRRREGAA